MQLPITSFKNQILEAIHNNPVVLISAETGAGKSTQVPQYLLDVGYKVVVTQPRRIAARNVAARIAAERSEKLGETIGFRTAYEKQDSSKTRCLFVTDGLALVRELLGSSDHQILIMDEVHEWNLNIEVLCAWAKRQIQAGSNFKLVVMSATMEHDNLSKYFGDAPVINVPGRTFPVEELAPTKSFVDDIAGLLKKGRNVLVFQPGKKEIQETAAALAEMKVSAEILELHGELSVEQQQKVFKNYNKPKCVIATNVAQTSITIDDIDAVVDSGVENRIELLNGVEGLYVRPISMADREQRKGRAGRVRPGVYIDWCPAANRQEYPIAEIFRKRLDQTVLRLTETGIDAEEMDFFHQPPKTQIHDAKACLRILGCLDEKNRITSRGRKVAKLPISVESACMILEAEKLGAIEDIITIAALLEQGDITVRPKKGEPNKWRKLVATEKYSDVLAQLCVYKAAQNMTYDAMIESGIFVKAFQQVKEKRNLLKKTLKGKVNFRNNNNCSSEQLRQAIAAGMLHRLYQNTGFGQYDDGSRLNTRKLNKFSVVEPSDWIVGIPFDLQIKTRYGHRTIQMVNMATKIETRWLSSLAPHLITTKENTKYCYERGDYVPVVETYFLNRKINETAQEIK